MQSKITIMNGIVISLLVIIFLAQSSKVSGQDNSFSPGITETPITLSSFTAISENGSILITWRTEKEVNTKGFNIFKKSGDGSDFIKINPTLIISGGNTNRGAGYIIEDNQVIPEIAYTYQLEEVDRNGKTLRYGSITAMLNKISGVESIENVKSIGSSEDGSESVEIPSGENESAGSSGVDENKPETINILNFIDNGDIQDSEINSTSPTSTNDETINESHIDHTDAILFSSKPDDGKIVIKWKGDKDAQYKITRREGKEGEFIDISDIEINTDDRDGKITYSIEDINLISGVTYYYRIKNITIESEDKLVSP